MVINVSCETNEGMVVTLQTIKMKNLKTAYYYVIMSNGTTDIAFFSIAMGWTYNRRHQKNAQPIAAAYHSPFLGFDKSPVWD